MRYVCGKLLSIFALLLPFFQVSCGSIAPPSAESSPSENVSLVVGRYTFYNNSSYDSDGVSSDSSSSNNSAIATNKTALLPGGTATFANYTNYRWGINGIMIDIENLPEDSELSVSDFSFKVGNDNTPGDWTTATEPASLSTIREGGVNGSTRITLIWADSAITKTWLQITVKANSNTGLEEEDVFYFGNAIGETGNDPTNAVVDINDKNLVLAAIGTSDVSIENNLDVNRNTVINVTDSGLTQANYTTAGVDALNLITPQ